LQAGEPAETIATTEYGGAVPAIVAAGHRAGTQFHVEKSQEVGLRILANFLAWSPA
jgi:glutamine amidotransferase